MKNHPSYKNYRKRLIRNAEKLRFIFSRKQATGDMSFSTGMHSIPSQVSSQGQGHYSFGHLEGMRDSDNTHNTDNGSENEEHDLGEESHSPLEILRNRRVRELQCPTKDKHKSKVK